MKRFFSPCTPSLVRPTPNDRSQMLPAFLIVTCPLSPPSALPCPSPLSPLHGPAAPYASGKQEMPVHCSHRIRVALSLSSIYTRPLSLVAPPPPTPRRRLPNYASQISAVFFSFLSPGTSTTKIRRRNWSISCHCEAWRVEGRRGGKKEKKGLLWNGSVQTKMRQNGPEAPAQLRPFSVFCTDAGSVVCRVTCLWVPFTSLHSLTHKHYSSSSSRFSSSWNKDFFLKDSFREKDLLKKEYCNQGGCNQPGMYHKAFLKWSSL